MKYKRWSLCLAAAAMLLLLSACGCQASQASSIADGSVQEEMDDTGASRLEAPVSSVETTDASPSPSTEPPEESSPDDTITPEAPEVTRATEKSPVLNQEMRTLTMSRHDMCRIRTALTSVVISFEKGTDSLKM